MKKWFWLVPVLLLACVTARANALDSLFHVYSTEKNTKLKVDYYLTYINKLSRLNRDSAIQLLIGYEDSCGNNFDYGRYRAQSLRAYLYLFQSKNELSLRTLHEALVKQKKIADSSGIAQTFNRLGLANNRFGHHDLAQQYLNTALTYFIALKDTPKIDMVLNNIGVFFSGQNQQEKAITYYKKSLAIRLKNKDFYWVGYSYYNISDAFLIDNRIDSSTHYIELALHTFKHQTETGNVPPMVLLGAGQLYFKKSNLSKALEFANQALEGSIEIAQTDLIYQSYFLLSQIYFSRKNYKEAYQYQEKYIDLKLSADSNNNAQAVAEIEAKYKTTEQALQIEHLNSQKLAAETKAQRLKLYAIITIAIILIIAALVGFIWLRRNQREKIERSTLLTKIADVKMFALRAQMNPHFIFNCINTAQHFVMNNHQRQAHEYLSDFAKLLRLVIENSAKTFIPVEDELEQLKLYIELEAIRFEHKFKYEIKLDPQLENGVFEIPGMLIQPIVENAIGHGLVNRNDASGHLQLELKLEDDSIICEVIDNGVGRERAALIKSGKDIHYQSAAIPNIRERLNVLQKQSGVELSLSIVDLKEQGVALGTKVVLKMPYQ